MLLLITYCKSFLYQIFTAKANKLKLKKMGTLSKILLYLKRIQIFCGNSIFTDFHGFCPPSPAKNKNMIAK